MLRDIFSFFVSSLSLRLIVLLRSSEVGLIFLGTGQVLFAEAEASAFVYPAVDSVSLFQLECVECQSVRPLLAGNLGHATTKLGKKRSARGRRKAHQDEKGRGVGRGEKGAELSHWKFQHSRERV